MHNELIVEYNYDFDLIGITASLKSHKMAWWLNKLFNIRLVREADICLDFLDESKVVISNFLYRTEHSYLRLLKNASEESPLSHPTYLLPEVREYDFLIMLKGFEGESLSLPFLQQKLERQRWVSEVASLEVEKLTAKENLVF